jgi:hypothetical protein
MANLTGDTCRYAGLWRGISPSSLWLERRAKRERERMPRAIYRHSEISKRAGIKGIEEGRESYYERRKQSPAWLTRGGR